MISFCCWKWGSLFSAVHVNVLHEALRRHVHVDHELVCITEASAGIRDDVRVIRAPGIYIDTPRCRRRMFGFNKYMAEMIGQRICYIDLDVVITGDLTPFVTRTEPIVGYKVGHAGVMSGSFLLADAGALDGAYQKFRTDPEGYPKRLQPNGVASDQAMINDWLNTQPHIPFWTEADGIVSYYGKGYERLEHWGVGPSRPNLPSGTRIVILGSADLDVLESDRFPWVREHWQALREAVTV